MLINIKSKPTTSGTKYTWTIVGDDGRTISSNKMYSTKEAAMKAAQSHLSNLTNKNN